MDTAESETVGIVLYRVFAYGRRVEVGRIELDLFREDLSDLYEVELSSGSGTVFGRGKVGELALRVTTSQGSGRRGSRNQPKKRKRSVMNHGDKRVLSNRNHYLGDSVGKKFMASSNNSRLRVRCFSWWWSKAGLREVIFCCFWWF